MGTFLAFAWCYGFLAFDIWALLNGTTGGLMIGMTIGQAFMAGVLTGIKLNG